MPDQANQDWMDVPLSVRKDKSLVFGVNLDAKDGIPFKLKGKNYLQRADGRIEWVCQHGIGHTVAVPEEKLRGKGKDRKLLFVHGCDSCCEPMIKQKLI